MGMAFLTGLTLYLVPSFATDNWIAEATATVQATGRSHLWVPHSSSERILDPEDALVLLAKSGVTVVGVPDFISDFFESNVLPFEQWCSLSLPEGRAERLRDEARRL